MTTRFFRCLPLVAVLASAPLGWRIGEASVFLDDFDTDTSAAWVVNKATGANANDAGNRAYFSFDYGTVGIPSAPHSVGGTTHGLKLQANVAGGIFTGLSVSPAGQSFAGDYILRFDLWQNYNGPLNGGGSGSTQVSGGGIGTAGTTAQWAGGAYDSIFFGTSGDGGSSVDYRVYPNANVALPASGLYAAGTDTSPDSRNNTHPYYAGFGGASAPAAQLALFAQQTGATAVGAQGFAWRDVQITKTGNIVTYDIDGVRIATVDATGMTLGGGDILLTYFDINATSSADALAPDLLFGLFDNVSVAPVPEPSLWAVVFGAAAGVFALIRRRARA
jgi:hypothetical protein